MAIDTSATSASAPQVPRQASRFRQQRRIFCIYDRAHCRVHRAIGGWYCVANNQLNFNDNVANATRFSINGSGNVGIGTAAPVAKLHVDGGR